MSRQSKQAKNLKRARDFSATRKSGKHGPEKTQRLHAKREGKFNTGSRLHETRGKHLAKISQRLKDGRPFGDIQGAFVEDKRVAQSAVA